MNTQTMQQPTVINGLNVTQFNATAEAIKNDPKMAEFKFRVSNKWETCGYNVAKVGSFYGAHQENVHENNFEVISDEPALLCGTDKGANPVETLLAALSGCMTTTLAYKSAAQGYNVEDIQSSYEGDIDLKGLLEIADVDQGFSEIRVNFKVKGDVPQEEIERIIQTSPVFDTLRRPIQLKIAVEKV